MTCSESVMCSVRQEVTRDRDGRAFARAARTLAESVRHTVDELLSRAVPRLGPSTEWEAGGATNRPLLAGNQLPISWCRCRPNHRY
jgi:hypothetical protein